MAGDQESSVFVHGSQVVEDVVEAEGCSEDESQAAEAEAGRVHSGDQQQEAGGKGGEGGRRKEERGEREEDAGYTGDKERWQVEAPVEETDEDDSKDRIMSC